MLNYGCLNKKIELLIRKIMLSCSEKCTLNPNLAFLDKNIENRRHALMLK